MGRPGSLRRWAAAALAAVVSLVLAAEAADAATLYISEFQNGLSLVGSTQPQIPPQPSVADQAIAVSGVTAASAAFNAKTHAVSLICDEGCSISFGAAPTATTSNYLLQQGVPVTFGVIPGQKVAVIANAAGNSGGGAGVNVTIVGPLGQAAMVASVPVVIASNQSSFPVAATLAAETTKVIGTVNQGTSPWVVSGAVTGSGNFTVVQPTGTNLHAVLDTTSTTAVTQATASNLNATVVGTGTFATQSAITAASGAIASGAIASGAVASGAYASGSVSDGAVVTLGAKADAKSTATDTTAVTAMQVLKEISFMAQTPAALPANQSTNVAQINGTTPLMGNGGTGTGALRVALVSDGTGRMATVDAVTAITNALPAGTNLLGKVGIDQTTPGTTNAVQAIPGTSGGLTAFVLEPAASDNHTVIKTTAGQVYGIHVFNNSATINYIRLYNATTGFNGCNSATNLQWEGHIPASTSDAGAVVPIPEGLAFATGISICVTGGYGQTNTTNATASAISVDVLYK